MTAQTTKCATTINSLTVSTTTCTITYTYAGTSMAGDARVEATVESNGKTRVVAIGTIRDHKLRLKFERLHCGRYRLTLIELRSHQRLVIGHTTVTVS